MSYIDDIGSAPGQAYDWAKRQFISLTKPDDAATGDYTTRSAAIARQQKLAEALSQMGAQEQAVSTAGGITAPMSPMGALARGLTSFGGSYLSGKAAADEAALDTIQNQKLSDVLSSYYDERPDMTNKNDLVITGRIDPATHKPGPNVGTIDTRGVFNRPTTGQEQMQAALGLVGTKYAGMVPDMLSNAQAEIKADKERKQPKLVAAGANGMVDSNPNSPTYGQRVAVPAVKPSNKTPFAAVVNGKPGMFVYDDAGQLEAVPGMTPFRTGGGDGGGPGGPFAGRGITAQFMNTLVKGNTGSPEYALAYNAVSKPRVSVDPDTMQPITIPGMDMSQFPKPTGAKAPDATGMTPSVSAPIGKPKLVKQAEVTLKTFDSQFKNLEDNLKKASTFDKSVYATTGVLRGGMANAMGAYNAMVTAVRDPELINTGVLQPAELKYMNNFLNNPGSLKGILSGDKATLDAFRQLRTVVANKLTSKQQVYGAGQKTPGQGGAAAPGGATPAPSKTIRFEDM